MMKLTLSIRLSLALCQLPCRHHHRRRRNICRRNWLHRDRWMSWLNHFLDLFVQKFSCFILAIPFAACTSRWRKSVHFPFIRSTWTTHFSIVISMHNKFFDSSHHSIAVPFDSPSISIIILTRILVHHTKNFFAPANTISIENIVGCALGFILCYCHFSLEYTRNDELIMVIII